LDNIILNQDRINDVLFITNHIKHSFVFNYDYALNAVHQARVDGNLVPLVVFSESVYISSFIVCGILGLIK
jgi:hypothetical protein